MSDRRAWRAQGQLFAAKIKTIPKIITSPSYFPDRTFSKKFISQPWSKQLASLFISHDNLISNAFIVLFICNRIAKKSQTATTEKAPKKGLLGKLGLKKSKKAAKEEEKPVEEAKPEAPEEKKVDPEPAKEDTRELEKPAQVDTEAKDDNERDQPEKKPPTSPLFCGCL